MQNPLKQPVYYQNKIDVDLHFIQFQIYIPNCVE